MNQDGRGRGDRLRVNWQRIAAAFHHLLLRAVAPSRRVCFEYYCWSACSKLHGGDCPLAPRDRPRIDTEAGSALVEAPSGPFNVLYGVEEYGLRTGVHLREQPSLATLRMALNTKIGQTRAWLRRGQHLQGTEEVKELGL